jgi:hypothetical protein
MTNRGIGTGFVAFGLVLVIVGAILDFAVDVPATRVNLNVVGLILLAVGIATFLIGIALFAVGERRRATVREESWVGPAGVAGPGGPVEYGAGGYPTANYPPGQYVERQRRVL